MHNTFQPNSSVTNTISKTQLEQILNLLPKRVAVITDTTTDMVTKTYTKDMATKTDTKDMVTEMATKDTAMKHLSGLEFSQ